MEKNKGVLTKAPAQSANSSLKANQEIVGLQKSMEKLSLNNLASSPSVGSSPKAPTLGPRKRARDPDPYLSVDDVPDLKLNNEAPAQGGAPAPVQAGAPAPAPTVSSSPKAHCLGLGGAEQRAKK